MTTTTFKLLSGGDTGCAGGHCPSVYLGSDGYVYVKGIIVTSEMRVALDVDANEDVVRIPVEVLRASNGDLNP